LTAHRITLLTGALITFILLFMLAGMGVQAAPEAQTGSATPTPDPRLSISNEECLGCHSQPGQFLTLENGDVLDLYVSPQDFSTSVHGSMGYACVQCHREIGSYPHPPFEAQDLREVTLKLYPACQGCHQSQYELAQDSVHATAFNGGMREAAVCTDCHTAHQTRRLNEPGTLKMLPDARTWVPLTCSRCHNAIYLKYRESVHGSALEKEGNQDVPTCIDCHDVHNIQDPTTAAFRLRSPDICAKCHTDEEKMAKYGLSTEVLNTYVADFHGTTVMLFEKMTPDAETNKPVCYDCHGIHDIASADDPVKGLQVRENLLARCQECHPDATSNFSTAWLSHYIPSPDKNPIVYYVNLFYKIFIPGVLGGMALLVVLDLNKTAGRRLRKSAIKSPQIEKALKVEETESGEPPVEEPIDREPEELIEESVGERSIEIEPEELAKEPDEQEEPQESQPTDSPTPESQTDTPPEAPTESGADPDEEARHD